MALTNIESESPIAHPRPSAAPYRPWVMRLLERHPGALLTGLYLALTAIGIAYDFFYFARFRVNILDYAEPGDFLVAAMRSPLAIIYSVVPVLVIWLVALFRRWLRRKSPRYDAFSAKYEKKWKSGTLYWDVMNTLLVVMYAFVFTAFYAKSVAVAAKRPDAPKVRVEVAAAAGVPGPTSQTATMVGTTGKFLFLYFPERDSTHVVPFENVLQVVTQARSERPHRGPITRLIDRARGVDTRDSAAPVRTPPVP